jgi:hypothetical protein
MKKALISPNNTLIKHITSWVGTNQPVFSTYPNSCRVAEVCNMEFEVAPPLFWVDCDDSVVADQFYFDTVANEILPIVNVPPPVLEQPQA